MKLRCGWASVVLALMAAAGAGSLQGQVWVDAHGPLDPGRALPLAPEPERAPLPEQYIWTANEAAAQADGSHLAHLGADENLAPHYFRSSFELAASPARATLYLAGPRQARIYLNGKFVTDAANHPASWLAFETFVVDVAAYLRPGRNTIALEVVRGTTHSHHTNQPLTRQLNLGEVVAAKIVAAGRAEEGATLMYSSGEWRSTLQPGAGWEQSAYDDSAWPRVQSLGGIESNTAFYQWYADGGLTNWPGYIGVSQQMRRYLLLPERVAVQTEGGARFERMESLTQLRTPTAAQEAVVHLPATTGTETPALLLDFGREAAGRVVLRNGGAQLVTADLRYGESMEELLKGPFLGRQRILLPPHGVARGMKSAFRYALVAFPQAEGDVRLAQAALEGIAYPVRYRASFASSDERLNRIWETAAYTAHLCMQEGVWDGVKRDRGKWMGDMDVTARVTDAVFADGRLNEQTFHELAGFAPYNAHVNSIAPYTAFWVMGEAAHYRRMGSAAELEAIRAPLKGLLAWMDGDVDATGLFANLHRQAVFVDWAPNFDHDTPDARRAVQFEYLLAFREGAGLLEKLGEHALAEKYRTRSEQMKAAAEAKLVDPATGTFGPYWQANAMAIVADAVSAERRKAIYGKVLAGVGTDPAAMQQVTPYFGYYVMEALARLGYTRQALDWMRFYWGGMLDEGATSFWEAYDPRWPRVEPHQYLQADHKKGYYVSMAHGWSSGPALWLLEHVAGMQSQEPGGHRFVLRPELAGLKRVQAEMPAGEGLLRMEAAAAAEGGLQIVVSVPKSCRVTVEVPRENTAQKVYLAGRLYAASTAADGAAAVELTKEGRYEITVR